MGKSAAIAKALIATTLLFGVRETWAFRPSQSSRCSLPSRVDKPPRNLNNECVSSTGLYMADSADGFKELSNTLARLDQAAEARQHLERALELGGEDFVKAAEARETLDALPTGEGQ